MGEKIAIGYHTCLDYELEWDQGVFESLIACYGINASEIAEIDPIASERDLVLNCLYHMRNGIGGEVVPEDVRICFDFANRFKYVKTIGGTATRAATAIEKIGYGSVVHMCCFSEAMKKLLPEKISYISSVGIRDNESPHVILQYPKGARIKAGGVDFVTPRENRVMCSRDIDGMEIPITEDFIPLIRDAEVFLHSSFSEVVDPGILRERITTSKKIVQSLNKDALVVMEDADYIKHEFRECVHKELGPHIDVLSMNEDELQDYVGRRLDMLDPGMVLDAVNQAAKKTGVPYLLVHSSEWAVIYGDAPGFAENALISATAMAATRYRKGDEFGRDDFEETKRMPDKTASISFCKKMAELEPKHICCVPGKDLRAVKNPTTVGLGDYFAGGLLPELTVGKRNRRS